MILIDFVHKSTVRSTRIDKINNLISPTFVKRSINFIYLAFISSDQYYILHHFIISSDKIHAVKIHWESKLIPRMFFFKGFSEVPKRSLMFVVGIQNILLFIDWRLSNKF